jgi:hypothetical protein
MGELSSLILLNNVKAWNHNHRPYNKDFLIFWLKYLFLYFINLILNKVNLKKKNKTIIIIIINNIISDFINFLMLKIYKNLNIIFRIYQFLKKLKFNLWVVYAFFNCLAYVTLLFIIIK